MTTRGNWPRDPATLGQDLCKGTTYYDGAGRQEGPGSGSLPLQGWVMGNPGWHPGNQHRSNRGDQSPGCHPGPRTPDTWARPPQISRFQERPVKPFNKTITNRLVGLTTKIFFRVTKPCLSESLVNLAGGTPAGFGRMWPTRPTKKSNPGSRERLMIWCLIGRRK